MINSISSFSDLFATLFKAGNRVNENDWLAETDNSV